MSLAGGLAGNLNPFQGLASSLSGVTSGVGGGGGGGLLSSLRASASSLTGMAAPMSPPPSLPPPPPPHFTGPFGGFGNNSFHRHSA